MFMRLNPVWSARGLGAAFACALLPLAAAAQQAGVAPPLTDWRSANEAVAQFKRGHIDLLKWENANLKPAVEAQAPAPNLLLMAPADVVRQAWRVHLDLARTQSQLGASAVKQIADGRFEAIDPSLQRRVEGTDELLEVAVDARKLWLEAVAARKALRFRQAELTSAEAGNELGQRMVKVGNWSPLQSTPFQLAHIQARRGLQQAQLSVATRENALLQLLRLSGTDTRLGLPDDLPPVPEQPMTREVWQQRLAGVQAHVPGIDAVRNRVASETAFKVYQASHSMARTSRDDVLRLRTYITEETVLHYNGMLKSVWDLLGEVSNQAAAEVDAIDAQRDFWLAQTDFQWTLQGGAPTTFVSPGGGGAEAAAPAH
jgi:hypothetical protein